MKCIDHPDDLESSVDPLADDDNVRAAPVHHLAPPGR